jgi:hypothetical protein
MNLDEDKLYIKIVAPIVIYNFLVKMFFNWTICGPKILLKDYIF